MFLLGIYKTCRKTYKRWKYESDMKRNYNRYKTYQKPRYFHRHEPEDYIFVNHSY